MKKLFCIVLAVAMSITALTACNSNANVSSSASASASVQAEPMKLTWVVYNQIGITPSNDSTVLKMIEEKFNVDITVPEVDIHTAEQWNLYWASGNKPDASFMNNTAASVFKLADQGLVREIPEGYLEQYMPDWMNVIYGMVDKDLVKQQTSYNGKQYICPWTSQQYPYVMAVRKDWMDNLGITKMPTTPDELLDLAKKFTFNDPDQNSKNDTYGIHGGGTKRYMRFGYLNSYYGIWPDSYSLVDGKVIYTSTTDTFKESLKYLNSWYEAGVVDPEFATDDRTVQRKKWAEGKFGIIVDNPWWFSASTSGNLGAMLTESNPDAEVEFFEPFTSKDGKQYSAAWFPATADDGSMFFGINCTDEKMAKIMEIKNTFVTDWDFYVSCQYGVEGTDYTVNEKGIIVPNADSRTPENMTTNGYYAFNITPLSYETQKAKTLSDADVEVYDYSLKFDPLYVYQDFNFSGLNESYSQYNADIQSISDEFYYNAIMGKVDIDTGFEQFKKDLDNAGLQKVLDEYQAGIN